MFRSFVLFTAAHYYISGCTTGSCSLVLLLFETFLSLYPYPFLMRVFSLSLCFLMVSYVFFVTHFFERFYRPSNIRPLDQIRVDNPATAIHRLITVYIEARSASKSMPLTSNFVWKSFRYLKRSSAWSAVSPCILFRVFHGFLKGCLLSFVLRGFSFVLHCLCYRRPTRQSSVVDNGWIHNGCVRLHRVLFFPTHRICFIFFALFHVTQMKPGRKLIMVVNVDQFSRTAQ